MAKKGELKVSKIVGYVEEIEQEDGDTGLQIVGDEHTYQVDMDAEGRKLLDYVDEEIEATGIVTKLQGVREIKISRFRLIEGYDDDDEAEDELNYDDDDFADERYED
jgi:hypothetical protein